jgi:hypothetical protein
VVAQQLLTLLPRPWCNDLQIPKKQLRRNHPDHRINQSQRQMPDHEPIAICVGLGSDGAIGHFALGADVVEAVSHDALSVRLAKRQAQKKGSAFAEPFLEFGGYAGT